jgi:hypothetical protein
MVEAGAHDGRETGIGEFLRSRARSATDGRLATDVAVGVTAIIVGYALRPERWLLLGSAGLCLASFGIWGVAIRAGNLPSRSAPVAAAISVAGRVFASIGIGAAIATGFFFWTFLMGTWIS